MAPVKQDIGGSSSEVRLEGKTLPLHVCVPTEADRMAMATQARPSGEGQPAVHSRRGVRVQHSSYPIWRVVQPPARTPTGPDSHDVLQGGGDGGYRVMYRILPVIRVHTIEERQIGFGEFSRFGDLLGNGASEWRAVRGWH